MEAPQGRGRITPLPPPEPDGIGRPVERAPRQWIPVGLALAGLVAFAVWLAGTGTPLPDQAEAGGNQSTLAPLSADDPVPPSTITTPPPTTTTPPTLGELLPWLDGSLVVFSSDSDGDFMSVWVNSLSEPQHFRLSGSNVIAVEPDPTSLSFMAYETAGSVSSLYLGGWQTQEPIFIGSHGFAWDPIQPGRLAWVGTDQVTGQTALYRKEIVGNIELVAPLPPGTRLVGWTSLGLITAEQLGAPVNLIDIDTGVLTVKRPTLTRLRTIDGDILATAVAEPLRASPTGTVIALGTADAFTAAAIEIEDEALVVPDVHVVLDTATTGFELRTAPPPELLADGEEIFSPDGRWSLSRDGSWVARTTSTGIGTAIQMRSIETAAVRVVALVGDEDFATVGFSADSEWFFTYSTRSDQLNIAADTGAQFVVPFDKRVRFGGVYVRR